MPAAEYKQPSTNREVLRKGHLHKAAYFVRLLLVLPVYQEGYLRSEKLKTHFVGFMLTTNIPPHA